MNIKISDGAICNHVRIIVNGIDVTNRCYEADEVVGIAKCYKRNEDGHFYAEGYPRIVAKEEFNGEVQILLCENAPLPIVHKYNRMLQKAI